MASSFVGTIICAGLGLAMLGLMLRMARATPDSSVPILLIGLLLIAVFASTILGLIRRERDT